LKTSKLTYAYTGKLISNNRGKPADSDRIAMRTFHPANGALDPKQSGASLDRLDIRILGLLYRGVSKFGFRPDVKGMYGGIAEKLEMDEDTLRKRVDRLHSMGVIRGWHIIVNPGVFGLNTYAVWMTVDSQLQAEEVMRKIRLVHGIITIAREMGNVVSIGIVCENQSAFRKRVELITELTGGKQLASFVVAQPRTEVEPTSTDWQIIDAITPDPLVSYA
jgi:DNA-binding Lrp family transcriptional regulator